MSVKNHWYCGVEGQQYGPYTWEQMRAMAEEGRLVADSYVRREVDPQWLTASQVPGLLKKKSKPPAATSTAQVPPPAKRAQASGGSSIAAVPAAPPVVGPAAGNGSSIAAVVRPVQTANPSAGNIPLGSAVTSSVAPSAPLVNLSTAAAPAPAKAKWKTDDEVEEEPKKNNTLLLVGILGGVVVFVALAGFGLVVWKRGRDRAREQADAKAAAEKAAADLAAALPAVTGESNPMTPAEANPTTPEAQVSPADPPPSTTAPQAAVATKAANAAADPAAAKLISKLSGWTDVTGIRGLTLRDLRLRVASAWLASDERGTRVEPAGDAASGAKYVFVELQITNSGKVARPYKSWNATAGTSAVMADPSGQPLSFVAPAATPGVSRLTTAEIPPGSAVTDTLVFAAPAGSVEKLRLALAQSALAGNIKTKRTHFALEIPHELLLQTSSGRRPSGEAASASGEGPISANQAPGVNPQDPVAGALGTAVAPAAPMPAPPGAQAAPAAPPAAPKFDPKAFDLELQKNAGLLDKDGKPVKGDAK